MFFAQTPLNESKHANLISNYLNSNSKTAKFSNKDLEDLYVNKEILTEETGVTNIYLHQRYKGIKIFNAISSVGIKNDKVFHFADRFNVDLDKKVNTVSELLNPSDAINKVAQHFKLGSVTGVNITQQEGNKYTFSKGNISKEKITVEKVFFEDTDKSLKLAWDLNVYTIDGMHWWSVRVDANTGQVLDVNDWIIRCSFGSAPHQNHNIQKAKTQNAVNLFKTSTSSIFADGAQYNVYALPTESPNHGPRQLISNPADPVASPFGWHDDDGAAGADYTTTRGNNVVASEDQDNNGGVGYMPDGGTSLDFDFPIDFNSQPSASIDASLTNLFYVSNMMHDIFYSYGLDIRTGGFQDNHYARVNAAGVGDPVFAEGLDGGGLDNANFATPPDGTSPRMQMYLWSSPSGNALTINGGSLDGGYVGIPAGFGPELTDTPLTADISLVIDDDSGDSTDPYDACDVISNGADLIGKIALINRGTCEFGVKVLAVQNAGAIAAIVITDDRDAVTMGEGATNPNSIFIPSIMISREDGDAIIAAINNSETISGSLTLPPFIDGNYDNGVIAHEYGHGISNRLTGGADNTDCLYNVEQMGEGWSDWVTLVTTMKSSDISNPDRGIGTYDNGELPDGTGIRPTKYSPNMAVNPATYGFTNDDTVLGTIDGEPVSWNQIVHNIGYVWGTVLWDLTLAYVDKYGFDADIINGNGGNNKAMQVIIDALKLQPCSPGMVDGRDAILAADVALTGGEDQCMIWEVFARRGLGVNASQGTPESINDQFEDFTMPDPDDTSLLACTTSTLSSDTFNAKDYRVYPNPTNGRLTIKSGKSLGDVMINLIDINGRQVLTKKATLFGEVELNVSNLKSGLYILNIQGDFINTNEKIIIN